MQVLDFDKLNRNKIGVIWGSGNGGIQTFQDQVEEFVKWKNSQGLILILFQK